MKPISIRQISGNGLVEINFPVPTFGGLSFFLSYLRGGRLRRYSVEDDR